MVKANSNKRTKTNDEIKNGKIVESGQIYCFGDIHLSFEEVNMFTNNDS